MMTNRVKNGSFGRKMRRYSIKSKCHLSKWLDLRHDTQLSVLEARSNEEMGDSIESQGSSTELNTLSEHEKTKNAL